jgi:glycosyltransferase involved in cell wall biosynthesis
MGKRYETMAGIGSSAPTLVIAGNDMGYKKKVESIIREKLVGHRVIFTGLLEGREKLAAYQDADVLVYPAIHEIFGLVPFEAMMCGTPVIVTDDCGCGEIIGREDIGSTLRYGDVQGLCAAIAGILKNPGIAVRRAEKGRKYILENLLWDRIGLKYEKLYTGIADKSFEMQAAKCSPGPEEHHDKLK